MGGNLFWHVSYWPRKDFLSPVFLSTLSRTPTDVDLIAPAIAVLLRFDGRLGSSMQTPQGGVYVDTESHGYRRNHSAGHSLDAD